MSKYATPRPWRTEGLVINGATGDTIVCAPGSSTGTLLEMKANAELICIAVNSYEAMKEALERVLYVLSYQGTDLEELAGEDLEEVVKAALALAKKENQP